MDKSKLMMIIIIALLVILLGTVIAVTVFLIGTVGGDGGEQPPLVVAALPQQQLSISELEPINLGDSPIATHLAYGADGRARQVRAEVIIGIDPRDEDAFEEFMSNFGPRVRFARSIAITIFNGLTYEQVRTPEGQAMVAEMIRDSLQEAFNTNLIVAVSFSEWVVV